MDEKESVFILGAGGVTSAVLDALWGFGSKQIYLSNRTKDKAIELKNMLKDKFDKIEILNIFRQRINNDVEFEFKESKRQVKKIALFRLDELFTK